MSWSLGIILGTYQFERKGFSGNISRAHPLSRPCKGACDADVRMGVISMPSLPLC